MRRYHHLVEGVLQPEEIDKLQEIFDAVIAQPWFDSSDYCREAFAAELIKLYRGGLVDLHRLKHVGTLAALVNFSRNTPEEKRQALQLLHDMQRADRLRKIPGSKPQVRE